MEKLLERKDVKKENRWAVETIYKNDNEYKKDVEKVKKEFPIIKKLVDKFLDSKEDFYNLITNTEKLELNLDKISTFISMKSDEDTKNSKYQSLIGELDFLYSEYNKILSPVIPRMFKCDEKKLKEYMYQDKLKDHKYYFDTILESKKHNLSETEEKLISELSPVIGNSSSTAYYLMNADLRFGKIKDKDGKDIELNDSSYSTLIKSDNREERKNAFEKYHIVYGRVNNTLASTYNDAVKYDVIISKIRKYKDSLDLFLSPSKIDRKVYTNLIETVHNNLNTAYKYFDTKKKLLGLDEFHLYDRYANVVKDNNNKYSFEEGKTIVKESLKVYGKEYSEVLDRAFDERWIDIYPNVGKRSGAYSSGYYESYPFVLLNYNNKYSSISTLAHELGHSLHTYFSNNYNTYINSNYPIFLAEIASTTNELLLSNYMYKNAKTKEEKLSILNEKLDMFYATLYRQTMFAEFELFSHEEVEKEHTLTADLLNNKYLELNKLYFSKNVVVDDLIKYEWSRVPHFYSSFYVYKYATSLSIACYVANNLINETSGFKEKYIEFLKSGGRDYPLEVLKIIDIDLSDNKVYQEALDTFKNDLDKFIELEAQDEQ